VDAVSGIVLDTDVASLHYKRRLPAKVRQFMAGQRVHVAFATAGELRQWAVAREWDWAARTGMQLWLESKVVLLPYDQRVAWTWGDIRGRAIRRGRKPPVNDLWIAACCIERGLPLLTPDRRDFEELERHEGLLLLPPPTADQSGVMEVRSPMPSYAALRSIERTGGRSAATRSQLAPASSDR
jgi:toxin FitB